MKTSACEVLLIEDDSKKGEELEGTLQRTLAPKFTCERLDTWKKESQSGAYEDRLAEVLEAPRFAHLTLIVTDRDLSKSDRYPGLSEAVVSKVARRLSIPLGVYASGKTDSLLERQRSGGDGRIILDSKDPKAWARTVRVLAEGFSLLRASVEDIAGSKTQLRKYSGPASVLAELLDAPEVVDHLTLYTRGDQRMISELMPLRSKRKAQDAPHASRQIAVALGLWLYDSVLRFPGVIVNSVAAGSLLGVDPAEFGERKVSRVFDKATYRGPFADPQEPRWWRHRLVELVQNARARDARELVKKLTGATPKPCKCAVNNRAPAGFVCVMTDTPVCEEHSVGGISWLPRGADLARVRRNLFEQIGPWIGMS